MQFNAQQPETWAPTWMCGSDAAIVSTFIHSAPLTTYERAVALGMRAMELNQNAAPAVAVTLGASSLEIAKQELAAAALPPMSVLRYLPDGTFVRKSVNDCVRPRRY